ncbi:MAG: HIT domain-containing protein [Candidatus Colwellbacteria bacterium]|nr:HIT domain-containing protein [Candidatus Colwellbacteria bacterium]
MTKKLVNLRYAKGSKYGETLKEIKTAKVCPFCPKTFKWHTKPTLRRTKNWLVTENFNSYKNARYHFLVISKSHKEGFQDLTLPDWRQISELVRWAIRKYKIKGGGLILRFGDSNYTGATVTHLHLHLIVPQLKRGKALRVEFPIG